MSVIAARTMGAVVAVRVKEGDRVEAGQELVVLDDRDMAQKAAAARVGLQGGVESSSTRRPRKGRSPTSPTGDTRTSPTKT